MSEDILRESWVYQEIGQQYLEERYKKAIEQGRILGQREMLLSLVKSHFPEVQLLAKQQIESIADSEVLLTVLFKLLDAMTVEEVKRILFEIDDSKNKH